MSIKLDNKALENIKTYKYKTHGLTAIERWFMDPFWNVCCELLPRVSIKLKRLDCILLRSLSA